MTSTALNGWTAARLDDLAADVAGIRRTLDDMHRNELQDLKDELVLARTRPRIVFTAYLAPFLAALIPTLVVLLGHV